MVGSVYLNDKAVLQRDKVCNKIPYDMLTKESYSKSFVSDMPP